MENQITISAEDVCECGHLRINHNKNGCVVCNFCKKFQLNKNKGRQNDN